MLCSHPQSSYKMGGSPARAAAASAARQRPARAKCAPNIPGGQDKADRCAANTPTNEDEDLRALCQLGREISQLWEVIEREGGAMISAAQATRMMELHQAIASGLLSKIGGVKRRLGAIEKQVTAIAKRPPTRARQRATWAAVAAALPATAGFRGTLMSPSRGSRRGQIQGKSLL
jgi:hypothetical protein